MNRLDEIKARADCYEATRTYEHALCLCEQALIAHVPALLAAVEAVLALHYPITRRHGRQKCAMCSDDWAGFDPVTYPCPTVTAIRTALGEEQ